jgi:hypothetical protein
MMALSPVVEVVYTHVLKPRPLRLVANSLIKAFLPSRVAVGNAIIWLNPNGSLFPAL